MRLTVICVGRARSGPEHALQDRYAGRITAWPLDIREVEEKRKLAGAPLRAAEAVLVRNVYGSADPGAALLAAYLLDESARLADLPAARLVPASGLAA